MAHFFFTTIPIEYDNVDGSMLVMGESDSGRTRVKIERNAFERLAKGPCPDKDACLLALVKHQATLEQAAFRALLRHRNGNLRVTEDDIVQ